MEIAIGILGVLVLSIICTIIVIGAGLLMKNAGKDNDDEIERF